MATRAAVYARLSEPKKQAELGMNIGDQRGIGEQLVERRGWELVGTYTDDGRGAYRDDARRPAWDAMLAAEPDVIVVRDAERLGRNVPDYAALLKTRARVVEWLDEETADVRWEVEPVSADTDEFGQKMLGARSYSRKIGAKVKRKIRLKAANGELPHGGHRAFGYERDGTVRPDEAAVILEVAHRWLAGESLSALCRDLAARGVVTPAGKPWQYARLRRMLVGPRVAGIRVHNGVETRGRWEAIVSDDLHRRLVAAESASKVKRAAANGSYALTGLIECGCGKPMYGFRQHARGKPVRLRYVCREGCGRGIAAPQAETWVLRRAFLAILAPELRHGEQARHDVRALREQVADVEARVTELDEAYWQERLITKERWVEQAAALQATLDDARRRLADARQRASRERDAPQTAQELAERWRDGEPPERNRLLRVAVARVVVGPAGNGGRFDGTRIATHFHDGSVDQARPEDRVDPEVEAALAGN